MILAYIAGIISGLVVLAIIIALGVNHCIDEMERTKDIVTESDLFNYYKDNK